MKFKIEYGRICDIESILGRIKEHEQEIDQCVEEITKILKSVMDN